MLSLQGAAQHAWPYRNDVGKLEDPDSGSQRFNSYTQPRTEAKLLEIFVRLAKAAFNREASAPPRSSPVLMSLFARRQLFRFMYNGIWTEIEAPDRATPHFGDAHSGGVVQVPGFSLHFKRS